jgi:carbonic anhydrase
MSQSECKANGFHLTRHSTYHPHDDSINSVMMIALFNFKVKHIVVTVSRGLVSLDPLHFLVWPAQGHTNCVGCNQALNVSKLPAVPASTSLQRFLATTATLARSLWTEDGPPTLDLLVEENVVQQVKNLLASDIIAEVKHLSRHRHWTSWQCW